MHVTAAYGLSVAPNSSIAITLAEMGVLAHPARVPTIPRAAPVAGSSPNTQARKLPEVAPMKKIGVTIPPLPQNESVIAVAAILTNGS